MKRILSYSLGIFLIGAGLASFVQSVNPNFLASADAASLSVSKSSIVLAIFGAVMFAFGALIIILKILKGKVDHGKERY